MTEASPLTCQELLDFIAAYLDGELPAEERARFEGHLDVCPACVDYLASYRETVRAAHSAYDDAALVEAAPEDLIRAVLASRRRD